MNSKRFYSFLTIAIFALFLVVCNGYSEDMVQGNVAVMNAEMPAMPAVEAVSQPAAPVVNAEAPVAPAAPAMNVEVPAAPAMNAEAPAAPSVNAETPSATEPKPAAAESKEIKWVWGEVSSVDAPNNKIIIKYLNYDTDVEETLVITVDGSTRFENSEGINAVKVGDNVGVDYMLGASGEAVAKSIALEKSEAMPEKTEAAPAAAMNAMNVEAPDSPMVTPVPQEAAPASQVNAEVIPAQK